MVATGDFDGDGEADVVALSTTANASSANGTWWGRFVFLHGAAGGELSVGAQTADVMTSGGGTSFQLTGDFDGDGRDDFVYGNPVSRSIVFSQAGRAIAAPAAVGSSGSLIVDRRATGAAALVALSSGNATRITWSAARVRSAESLKAPTLDLAAFSGTFGADLDGDGSFELFGRGNSNTTGGKHTLQVGSIGATTAPATTFYGLKEYPDVYGGVDLDGNGTSEIVYGEGGPIYAACGWAPGTKDLVATPLGPTVPVLTTVMPAGDLNGDGRPDFVAVASNRFQSAFLSGPKPATAAPLVTLTDTPPAAGGNDAGAATDGGKPPSKDAGTRKDAGRGDDDDDRGDDDDDDGESANEQPAATPREGGCAQAGAIGAGGHTAAAGLGLALAMLARRHRGRA